MPMDDPIFPETKREKGFYYGKYDNGFEATTRPHPDTLAVGAASMVWELTLAKPDEPALRPAGSPPT